MSRSGARIGDLTPRPSCPAVAALIQLLEPRLLYSGDPGPTGATPPAVPLRVNAGGAAYIDALARPFEADHGFTGGRAERVAAYDVANTTDDPLFHTYHAGGAFTFARAVPDGNYALWLEFAEPTADATAGQRVFDVWAEGRPVLDDFDIVRDAGAPRRAVAKASDVAVTDGTLDLSFRGVVGEAVVSAVVLVPTDVPAEAAPYAWTGLSDGARHAVSQMHLREIGLGVLYFANENRGRLPADLATVKATQDVPHTDFASPRTASALPRGELSALEQAGWVATRRDYIYLGAGMRSADLTQHKPLAYENPDRTPGPINVLMGDGSVRYFEREAAAELIGFDPAPPTDPPPPPAPVSPDPRVVASQSNLRQIAAGMRWYANEHRGVFPGRPGPLLYSDPRLGTATFVNPRTGDTPPADGGWTLEQKIEWINARTDYVYLGAGLHPHAGAYDLMAYESPAGMAGGINLLFGDGRAEFRESRWAAETIAAQPPPAVIGSPVFGHGGRSHSLTVRFTRDLSATLAVGDLVLTNLTTGRTVPTDAIALAYDVNTRRATFTFPGFPGGVLPDANYRATLAAGSVADLTGKPLAADVVADFFVLTGDVNRNRRVDLADFGVFRQYFGATGVTYEQGDLNSDGRVDLADFGIFRRNFGRSLPVPPAAG